MEGRQSIYVEHNAHIIRDNLDEVIGSSLPYILSFEEDFRKVWKLKGSQAQSFADLLDWVSSPRCMYAGASHALHRWWTIPIHKASFTDFARGLFDACAGRHPFFLLRTIWRITNWRGLMHIRVAVEDLRMSMKGFGMDGRLPRKFYDISESWI